MEYLIFLKVMSMLMLLPLTDMTERQQAKTRYHLIPRGLKLTKHTDLTGAILRVF